MVNVNVSAMLDTPDGAVAARVKNAVCSRSPFSAARFGRCRRARAVPLASSRPAYASKTMGRVPPVLATNNASGDRPSRLLAVIKYKG